MTKTDVSKLYVVIFNRASEGKGNTFWRESFDSNVQVANAMLSTSEVINYFGDTLNTNQTFVEHIYQNTLNKTIDNDPDGISFWVNQLDSGISKGEMISNLISAMSMYEPGSHLYNEMSEEKILSTENAYNLFIHRTAQSDYIADMVAVAPKNYLEQFSFDNIIIEPNNPLGSGDVDSTISSVNSINNDLLL